MEQEDYKADLLERILDLDNLVRGVFSGRQRGKELKWQRAVVRPVDLRGNLYLQISYFDGQKDITKNYIGREARDKAQVLLDLPFSNVHLDTRESRLQLRITKKGKVLTNEKRFKEPLPPPDLSHDREKKTIISAEGPVPWLQAVGIMSRDGKIRADRQRKFKQINEFLRLVRDMKAFDAYAEKPLRIVDFGSGGGYLTFAAYHFFNDLLETEVHITGVDLKRGLLERLQHKAGELGWDRLRFETGSIDGYRTETPPDMVMALHACDTATDDALVQAVRWGSRIIVAAPCCQHDLQVRLAEVPVPEQFNALARDGILYERLGDLLTDTFRAAILRIMGYRTDVIEFIATEHTPKNLMIRCVKTSEGGQSKDLEAYRMLKEFWQVTPYLEEALSADYPQWFAGK